MMKVLLGILISALFVFGATYGEIGICAELCAQSGPLKCQPGYECLSNGCGHTCQRVISKVKCEPVFCMIFCAAGWAKDENGCDICALTCQPVTCDIYCPYGWQKDKNGCDFCACQTPPNTTE